MKDIIQAQYSILGSIIEYSILYTESAKYLGIIIDSKLKVKQQYLPGDKHGRSKQGCIFFEYSQGNFFKAVGEGIQVLTYV